MTNIEVIQRKAEALSADAEAAIRELEVEIEELQAQIKNLRPYTIRKKQSQNGSKSSKSHGKKASPGAIQRAAEAIQADFTEEAFSAADLTRRTNLHVSSAYAVVRALRDRQVIYPAEAEQVDGARTPTQFYRVMDAQLLQQIADSIV